MKALNKFVNDESGATGITTAVIGAVLLVVGLLIVTQVVEAANFTGTISTFVNLLGIILAAGGIIFILMALIPM